MKDIKDYLHLYKGQQGRYFKPKKQEWSEWKTIDGEFIHTIDILDWQAQISLRPLSDMTEDEFDYMFFKQPGYVSIESKVVSEKRFDISPHQVAFLLSKGFDLFQLIEAGLAIDKTTLKQEA